MGSDFPASAASKLALAGRPLRVAGKEAVREADLIGEENSESQTYQAGGKPEPVGKILMLSPEEVEGRGDAHGDQHHAADRSGPKDEQVNHRPARVADGGENQQRDRSGTRQSVNDPDDQRTQLLVEADPAKNSIEPGERSLMSVRMRLGRVSVRMAVYVVAVDMGMRMNNFGFFLRGNDGARCSHEGCNIHRAQYDQHEPHGEFHGEADAGGNHHVKENNRGAHDKDCERMADTPNNAGKRSLQQLALTAYDRSNGDYVVGIGGMAHSEKKPHRDNRKKTDHDLRFSLDGSGHARFIQTLLQETQILIHSLSVFGG